MISDNVSNNGDFCSMCVMDGFCGFQDDKRKPKRFNGVPLCIIDIIEDEVKIVEDEIKKPQEEDKNEKG